MAFVRPSLVLQALLRPEDYTPETEREIKRSYMFIAQSIVRLQEADDAREGNVMRFSIRLMKPYWDTADPEACALWDEVMPRWLRNQSVNVTTAMRNYNTVTHNPGARNVTYEWADFEFNNHATLRVKLNDDNTISADVAALSGLVRRLAGEGVFGEEMPALIRIPSKASIQAQRDAYEELRAEVARARAEAEAAAAAAAEAARAAQAGDAEAPEAEEALSAAEAAPDAAAAAAAAPEAAPGAVVIDAEAIAEADAALAEGEEVAEEAAPAALTLPPFAYDFSIWGLEYADGRVVEFDSTGR